MYKNNIFNFSISALFLIALSFVSFPKVYAALSGTTTLPDNVTVSSSPDGSATTVVINSKPGFSTNVQTRCVSGVCTHTATTTAFTAKDIRKMQEGIKKQQEAFDRLWRAHHELFLQQQKMFERLWGVGWF